MKAGACEDTVCLVIHNVGRLLWPPDCNATNADCCSHAADYCKCDTRDVVKYGVQGSDWHILEDFDERRPRLVPMATMVIHFVAHVLMKC